MDPHGSSPLPPPASLRRPKAAWRAAWDLLLAPARLVALPDRASESLGLTSLRAERFAAVLPELRGRCLDVGAGDNALMRCYRALAAELGQDPEAAAGSVGVDVVDWGGDSLVVESARKLPFADASFDSVVFLACLNHIPERREALFEARRLLRPGGRLLISMISRRLGELGHRLWWYSEEKHRHVDEHELMGMDDAEIVALVADAGFALRRRHRFVYGLNTLYVCEPA